MPPDSLLDRPQERARLWPLTVEAYHALGEAGLIPEKTELLYGFVFNKMPKSPIHRAVVQRLMEALRQILLPGWFAWNEQPLTCGTSEPEPDVMVIHGHADDFLERHPTSAELVIEVAVSSQDYDREKIAAYATAGVKEYWIVLVPERQVEVYRQPQKGNYNVRNMYQGTDAVQSSSVPNFNVSLERLLP